MYTSGFEGENRKLFRCASPLYSFDIQNYKYFAALRILKKSHCENQVQRTGIFIAE